MIYCVSCGKELPDDANFCLKCGRDLRSNISQEANKKDDGALLKIEGWAEVSRQVGPVKGIFFSKNNYVASPAKVYIKTKNLLDHTEQIIELTTVTFYLSGPNDYRGEEFNMSADSAYEEAMKNFIYSLHREGWDSMSLIKQDQLDRRLYQCGRPVGYQEIPTPGHETLPIFSDIVLKRR
jgi:hypothetical protein